MLTVVEMDTRTRVQILDVGVYISHRTDMLRKV